MACRAIGHIRSIRSRMNFNFILGEDFFRKGGVDRG